MNEKRLKKTLCGYCHIALFLGVLIILCIVASGLQDSNELFYNPSPSIDLNNDPINKQDQLRIPLCFTGSFFSAETSNDETMRTKKIYSESSDGISKFLGSSNVHSWMDVRNNSTGNQAFDDWDKYLKGILAAYNSKLGDMYVISRSFFSFNTTFLPLNVTIHQASLFLYGCGTNESNVCVVSWSDGSDGVDTDDYGYTGSENLGNTDSWFLDTYNEISLNDKGLDYINCSGYTYVACREYDHDFLNVKPEDKKLAEYRNGHYFADEPGTEKDPYLLITYTDGKNDDGLVKDTSFLPLSSIIMIMVLFLSLLMIKKKEI